MLRVQTDFKEATQALRALKRAAENAVVSTLNKTAFSLAREEWPKIAKRTIDRPTPFTLRGGRYKKATRNRRRAVVYLAPRQERYLLPLLTGQRIRKVIPGVIRLNRYGNVPSLRDGRKIRQLLAKPGHFRQTINGTDAIWRRVGNRLRPVLLFDTSIYIRKRLDFANAMSGPARRYLNTNARGALAKALRTARL